MKTARFAGGKKVVLEEKSTPVAGEGQVVVAVKSCGLCGSERENYLNGYIHHQGHEVAGVVTQVGPGVTNVRPGDRVVVYLTSFCGDCVYCQQGMTTMCLNYPEKVNLGWAYPGGFAEYLVTNAQNALPLDEELSFEDGVLLLDTLGTPFHGLRLARAEEAGTALVWLRYCWPGYGLDLKGVGGKRGLCDRSLSFPSGNGPGIGGRSP